MERLLGRRRAAGTTPRGQLARVERPLRAVILKRAQARGAHAQVRLEVDLVPTRREWLLGGSREALDASTRRDRRFALQLLLACCRTPLSLDHVGRGEVLAEEVVELVQGCVGSSMENGGRGVRGRHIWVDGSKKIKTKAASCTALSERANEGWSEEKATRDSHH